MTKKRYTKELKQKIIRLHLEEGRTIKSLNQEYHLGHGTLNYWLSELRKECQTNPYVKEVTLSYEESKQLLQENKELKKENDFLKKAAAFFAKEIE